MSAHRYVMIIIGGGLLACGLGLRFMPVKERISTPIALLNTDTNQVSMQTINPAALSLFDGRKLPAIEIKQKPAPRIDPGVALRSWKVTGIIMSDSLRMVIMQRGSRTQTLHIGDDLEGFEFVAINGRNVEFSKGGQTATLVLPDITVTKLSAVQ